MGRVSIDLVLNGTGEGIADATDCDVEQEEDIGDDKTGLAVGYEGACVNSPTKFEEYLS